MSFTREKMFEIWDEDQAEDYIEIGPDRDGLGCAEIRYKCKDAANRNKYIITERLMMAPDQARAVALALLEVAEDLGAKEE